MKTNINKKGCVTKVSHFGINRHQYTNLARIKIKDLPVKGDNSKNDEEK
jgi:hypothetical protein